MQKTKHQLSYISFSAAKGFVAVDIARHIMASEYIALSMK
jgi:hypothetical protein